MRAEEAYLRACRAGGWPPERRTLHSLAEASLTLDLRLCSPPQLLATCATLKEKPSGINQSLETGDRCRKSMRSLCFAAIFTPLLFIFAL